MTPALVRFVAHLREADADTLYEAWRKAKLQSEADAKGGRCDTAEFWKEFGTLLDAAYSDAVGVRKSA